MIDEKREDRAIMFKNCANHFFNKKEFDAALLTYNKALNHAISKESQSLVYANRAAVYLHLKKYQRCLKNIQWALDHGYPAEKVPKLLERKARCEEMMKNPKTFDYKLKDAPSFVEEDAKKFFKLSYPANPKIPFIIDGLEMRMTETMGRGIFTTRDLKPGDIISIEEPVLTSMGRESNYRHCCNCLASKDMSLIPCLKTASLMFCSEKCRDEIYAKVKQENFGILISSDLNLFPKILNEYEYAFGGRDNILKFIKENNNNFKEWNKTVFDYDFSNPDDPDYKMNALKSILSYFPPKVTLNKNDHRDIGIATNGNDVLNTFMKHVANVYRSSCISTCNLEGMEKLGTSTHGLKIAQKLVPTHSSFVLFSPLMNYSCFPNIHRTIPDNRFVLYVTRFIKAGEELFRGFASLDIFKQPAKERREYFESFAFSCNCYYCVNDMSAETLPHSALSLPPLEYFNDNNLTLLDKIIFNFKLIKSFDQGFPHGTNESFMMNSINHGLIGFLRRALQE